MILSRPAPPGALGITPSFPMRQLLSPLVFSALLAVPAFAAPATKLNVLLVTGGHAFPKESFLQVFQENPAISFTHREHTKGTADVYDRKDLGGYDVVVLYDMPRVITEAQKAGFLALLERGAGLVVTHHALCSFQAWPEYERIIGGRYFEKPKPGTVSEFPPSGYQHDEEVPVVVSGKPHPVTAGVANFTIHDEIYWGYRVGADVTPLLTTTHPKSGNPLAWYRTQGKSRVVYLLLGHDEVAYAHPGYRRLLANAILWTGRR